MRYTLLRNATALLEYGSKCLLIDPSLDPAGYRPAIANTANQRPNPLVELPDGWQQQITGLDACIVTHLHQDHFDSTAKEVLPGSMAMLAQPEDRTTLEDRGFTRVTAVEDVFHLGDIAIRRTAASHGRGAIAAAMAPVSGFVLRDSGEPVLYIAGDTIWYEAVEHVIEQEQPDVIIVNGGGASFLEGGPIIMNAEDIAAVRHAAPKATIIVVHLEAINHCHETRAYYRERLPELGMTLTDTLIPEDGETVTIAAPA